MGWNSKHISNNFSANWRDYFDVEKLELFAIVLDQDVQEFIENKLNQAFADELKAGEVIFHVNS